MEVHEIRNHILNRKESLCPQLVECGGLCWRRHLFYETPLAPPARLTHSRAAHPPSASKHTHKAQALYMSANTTTH